MWSSGCCPERLVKLAAVGGSRCDVRERGAVADVEVGVLLRRRGVERGGSAGPLSGNAGGGPGE